MSLKQILYQEIKSRGNLTLNQIEAICHDHGYKISNAERRLRELMATGSISPIKNSKGAIIGYCKALQGDLKPVKPETDIKYQMSAFQFAEERLKANDPYSY